jgi:hypothetical protein
MPSGEDVFYSQPKRASVPFACRRPLRRHLNAEHCYLQLNLVAERILKFALEQSWDPEISRQPFQSCLKA